MSTLELSILVGTLAFTAFQIRTLKAIDPLWISMSGPRIIQKLESSAKAMDSPTIPVRYLKPLSLETPYQSLGQSIWLCLLSGYPLVIA